MQNLNETILTTGDSYFAALLQDIDNARISIDVEIYIFATDFLAQKIAYALANAAKRGVQVRVHVDGIGSRYWGGSLGKELEAVGVKTRVFHPFPWSFWHWSHALIKVPTLYKFIYLIAHINARNHRKLFIIDSKIAYIGSFNISKVHLTKAEGGDNWRDIAIRLTNIDLSYLQEVFNMAWDNPNTQRFQDYFQQPAINTTFRVNNTRKRRRRLYKNLLRKMGTCTKQVWIMNAYFVPDNLLLKQLRQAARRNVDVRILLPHKSDIAIMPWAAATFYESLLKSGIRIFEYLPSMLHAKVIIIDNWITVGSSNLNHRSLLHDLEIDVVVRTSTAKKIIKEQFLADLTKSKEITLADWGWRPWYKRWLGQIILYIKYMI